MTYTRDIGSITLSTKPRRLCKACGRHHIHKTDETVHFKDGIANIICADRIREAILIETKLITAMRKQGVAFGYTNISKGRTKTYTPFHFLKIAKNLKLLTATNEMILKDYYGKTLYRKLPA